MRKLAIIQALIAAALFGAATPVSHKLLQGFNQNLIPHLCQLAGLLYLGAAIGIAPFVLARYRAGGKCFPTDLSNRKKLAGSIFFGGMLGPVLLLLGLKYAASSSVSMWLSLETVATAVIAFLFFREHLSKWTWGCNAGVLVSGLMLGYGQGWAGWLGFSCTLGAAVAWGVDNNVTSLIDGIAPEDITFWKGIIAGSTNLTLGMILAKPVFNLEWLGGLLLGAISYGAGTALYVRSAQKIGASRSQMFFATGPFFGVILAVIWLGDTITPLRAIAALVLAVSISLMFIERHKHEHAHDVTEHDHEHQHDDGHHDHEHIEIKRHAHVHKHEPLLHTHPHWPDLHHRHH